jgi:hypothetical protein
LAELLQAALTFVLLLACMTLGLVVRPRLPERHRDQQTLESVRLAIGMLVTFVALVLGLLTASSKGHFDAVSDNYRAFGGDIVVLHSLLAEYGPETVEARSLLRNYTGAVIASTWPDEPAPPGDYPRTLERETRGTRVESRLLSTILGQIDMDIRRLTPGNAVQKQLAADSMDAFKTVIRQRWKIIESAHSTISQPFVIVMLVWLSIVFFCFALCAKRNATVVIVAVLCAFSTALSIYVILDMDSPVSGQIAVPSQPLRDALADLGP